MAESSRSDEDALAETGLAVARAPSGEIASGAKLGRYVVKNVLGSGGMGVVYRAFDPELGRVIALKVVHPGDRDVQQSQSTGRLVREAQAMARVAHPNVIVVHDAGTVGDQVFVAMELVDGENLATWESSGTRSWREIIEVYIQAARGLAAAHDAGLVHRDFKPANALIARDGRVRVLDFGLARTLDEVQAADSLARAAAAASPTSTSLTQTGAVVGTPQYMSPEQHLGTAADARSDQFSFCVALYHALYADYPFAGKSFVEIATQVTDGSPAPPPKKSDVPPAIGKVVMRGLSRDPALRFASMHDVIAALHAALPRKRWPVFAAIAIAAAAVAVIIALAVTRHSTSTGAPIAMAFATNQQPVTFTGELAGSPALSPDGKTLVFGTENGFVFRDLTTGTSVDVREPRSVWDIRWSPAGDRLLTATDHGIVIRDPAGAIVKVIETPPGSRCHAAWSPDGTEALWRCGDTAAFTRVDLASGAQTPLAVALPANERVVDFDWSAAGLAIATYSSSGGAIFVAHSPGVSGSAIRKLASDSEIGSIRWNGRGTRIYYCRGAAQGFEIVYRHATTGAPVVVLVQPQGHFTFESIFALAHDERSIIYLQRRLGEDIALQASATAPVRPLTGDGQLKAALAVSPDGSAIAFAAGTTTVKRVYHLPLHGGAPRELALAPGDVRTAAFSPSGREVALITVITDHCELWVAPVDGAPARKLAVPIQMFCNRVDWLTTGKLAVMQAEGHNPLFVDPQTSETHQAWATDAQDDLRSYAMTADGTRLAANIVRPDRPPVIATVDTLTGWTEVISAASTMHPIGWSEDGAWIYGVEGPAEDTRPRVIAMSASRTGATRLVSVPSIGTTPVVLPHEAGVVWIPRTDVMDFWLASIDRRPPLTRGPPAPPPALPTPPPFLAAPKNLALAGTAGSVPDGWDAIGTPAIATTCGRPGSCVELPGDSAIVQRIDATPYRGHRISIRIDLRVTDAECVVTVESGIYARAEILSGQLRTKDTKDGKDTKDQAWVRRELVADIAPDAIYIVVRVAAEHAGTARIGPLELEVVSK